MYVMKKYCFHFRKPLHTRVEKEKKMKMKKQKKPLHQVFVLQQEQKLLITNMSDKMSVVLGRYTRVGNS